MDPTYSKPKNHTTSSMIVSSDSAMSLMNSRMFLLILIFLPLVKSLFFNFTEFNETAKKSIDFQLNATVEQGIWLTKKNMTLYPRNSTGRAVYKEKLQLWDAETGNQADFSTHFSFSLNAFNKSDISSTHGLTFFLLSDSSIIPDDSDFAFLGLYTKSEGLRIPVYSYVAVEVDTYFDLDCWDPSYEHLGININSFASSTDARLTGYFRDDRIINAWISYDSGSKNLSVLLTYDIKQTISLWYIVNLAEILPEKVDIGFSAAGGLRQAQTHKILTWAFQSNLLGDGTGNQRERSKKRPTWAIVGLPVGGGGILVALVLIWFILFQKKAKRLAKQKESNNNSASIDHEFEKDRVPRRFSFDELKAATRNFAEERKLGRGGFGEVYRGFLNNEEVAVKKVSAGSKQGRKEYMAEVKIIRQLRHRNLVPLVGWCHKNEELLLVYKFMPNGSLDSHLYSQERFLSPSLKYRITLGLASALLYLHELCDQCVVHRDIKPSNVVLDSNFDAKLGDFGLSKLVDHEIGAQTTTPAGTWGYLAPECFIAGRASKESDVYSFGVVALEIACGRRPVDHREDTGTFILVKWVWELYGKDRIIEAADQRIKLNLEEMFQIERLLVVGLWCAHPDANLRPSIRQAINALNFEAPLPDLRPLEPVAASIFPMLA